MEWKGGEGGTPTSPLANEPYISPCLITAASECLFRDRQHFLFNASVRVTKYIDMQSFFSDRQSSGKIISSSPVGSPEGRPEMSDVSPLSGISGLSFDSILLSPLLLFCLVLLPFLSYLFFCLLVHSSELSSENSSIFFVKR